MNTGDTNHFDDRLIRIEDKLDRYSERISAEIVALSGRLSPLERDMATAKRAIAVGGAGIVAVLWDQLKKKIGIS